MSIADISAPTLFDTSLATEVTSVTPVSAITSGMDSNTAGDSPETPTRRSRPPADGSGTNTDLGRFKEDLQAQLAPTLSSALGDDLASLLKDMTSGNTPAARVDAGKIQVELQTQDASFVAGSPTAEPLGTLMGEISDSLTGILQGALQDAARHDLANFLVENGKGTGSLINTSA